MSVEIIGATIQVDTGSSNANIKGLNTEATALKTNLKETGDAAKEVGKEVEGSTGSFGKLKEKMSSLPGPLGQAGEGVGKLQTAFKALLANPVVLVLTAIVGVLALMYKAFENTFAGGQKLEQIFAGIKAAGQALLDNLTKIGSAIVKVFSFDFSGAIDDIKGVAKAANDAYDQVSKLTAEAQKLQREQNANDLEAVDRQAKLAALKEKIGDGDIPLAERKKAIAELKKDAEQNAKDDLDLAKRTAENKIALLTVEKDGALKNEAEITKIRIEQRQGEIENSNELRRINKLGTAADKEEAAARKEIADKAEADRKANAAASLAARKEEAAKLKEFNSKLTGIEQENILAKTKEGYERDFKALELKYHNEIVLIEESLKQQRITREQARQLERANDEKFTLELQAVQDKKDAEEKKKQDEKNKAEAEAEAKRIKNAQDSLKGRFKDNLNDNEKKADVTLEDPAAALAAKLAAIDAEVLAVQLAFDAKAISEEEYNTKLKEFSDQRKAVRDEEKEHSQKITSAIGDAFETLSELAGKQTAAGKALAIASTTIKTFQSAVAAFQGMVTSIPGPVGIALGVVAAAGAIATGIAAVKKIVAVQIPGKGGGGSGGAAPSGIQLPSAPIAPVQQGTKIDQNSIRGIGDATSGRTYVLSDDISKDANRQSRLNRAARLGG